MPLKFLSFDDKPPSKFANIQEKRVKMKNKILSSAKLIGNNPIFFHTANNKNLEKPTCRKEVG